MFDRISGKSTKSSPSIFLPISGFLVVRFSEKGNLPTDIFSLACEWAVSTKIGEIGLCYVKELDRKPRPSRIFYP